MILEELSNAFGPSGCEQAVRDCIQRAVRDCMAELRTDHLGNLIGSQPGTEHRGFRVLVAAHMDEIGFLITHADDAGFLHFVKVGGFDDRVLPAKTVRLGADRIPGVLAIKPVHLTKPDERTKVVAADQLVIDIGASSKSEAEKFVKKGDYGVFATEFRDLGEVVTGKAFDDRAGCAMLIEVLRRGPYPVDLCPVFTTMEEIGCRGARVAAYAVEPHAAIALEGTICDDGPRTRDESPTTELGKGPAISVADRMLIADQRLVQHLIATATACSIPWQVKQPGMGATDAGAIHLAKTGVPSVPVSVPCRYIHSPVALMSKRDFENTVALVSEALKRMSPAVLADRP